MRRVLAHDGTAGAVAKDGTSCREEIKLMDLKCV